MNTESRSPKASSVTPSEPWSIARDLEAERARPLLVRARSPRPARMRTMTTMSFLASTLLATPQ